MLIVSGRLYIKPGHRDEYLKLSLEAVALAREARGCRDFVVAPDPMVPDRVNVYEEWESEDALLTFRNAEGPPSNMFSLIERFDVSRHLIASSGPP
jgi:quinol monooxygenase YgiN